MASSNPSAAERIRLRSREVELDIDSIVVVTSSLTTYSPTGNICLSAERKVYPEKNAKTTAVLNSMLGLEVGAWFATDFMGSGKESIFLIFRKNQMQEDGIKDFRRNLMEQVFKTAAQKLDENSRSLSFNIANFEYEDSGRSLKVLARDWLPLAKEMDTAMKEFASREGIEHYAWYSMQHGMQRNYKPNNARKTLHELAREMNIVPEDKNIILVQVLIIIMIILKRISFFIK